MSTETSTVALNLAGDFAAQATAAANAADRLGAELDALKPPSAIDQARAQLKAFQVEAAAAEKAAAKMLGFADRSKGNAFEAAMKSYASRPLPEALQPKLTPKLDFGKNALAGVFSGVERAFGPGSGAGLRDGASRLIDGAEKLRPVMPLLKAGGAAVAAGAAALGAAALALVYGAGKVVASAVTFGVEQTNARKRVEDAIGKDGYAVGIKVAGDFDIDQNKAFEQVKGLLAAKFSAQEVPAIIRIAAGIGEMKGEGKAAAFLEKMEAMANKGGKANEEAVKGFAEVGISTDKVYAALAAKLGISIQAAKNKVKAGTLDMKVALEAVQAAGAAEFGPVADKLGKSVPGLLNKIKVQFSQLFSGFDLSPLKGALETVSKVLGGPKGEALGASLSKLGSTVLKALFGPFEGAKGEERLNKFLNGLTNAIEMTTSVIAAIAPFIEMAVDGFTRIFGERQTSQATGFTRVLFGVLDALSAIATLDLSAFVGAMGNIAMGVVQALADAALGAVDAGLAVAQGFAAGITGGIGEAIGAAIGMARGAIQGAREALGVASPSKAFTFLGSMSKAGFVRPMNDNGDVEAAGKSMAESAIGGAVAGGAGGAGGGAAGGNTYQITITVEGSGGGKEQAQAIGEEVRRVIRDVERERQERVAA